MRAQSCVWELWAQFESRVWGELPRGQQRSPEPRSLLTHSPFPKMTAGERRCP